MTARLDSVLSALTLAARLAVNEDRAVAVLHDALRNMVNPLAYPSKGGADGLGAPFNPKVQEDDWGDLRAAVRTVAAEIGWDHAARRYGGPTAALRDMVYRNRQPGAGGRARLLQVIKGGMN